MNGPDRADFGPVFPPPVWRRMPGEEVVTDPATCTTRYTVWINADEGGDARNADESPAELYSLEDPARGDDGWAR